MLEHAEERLKRERKETVFRMYVTDALRIITENTAKLAGGGYLTARWIELEEKKADGRTGDEIAADVIRRVGLRFREDDNG